MCLGDWYFLIGRWLLVVGRMFLCFSWLVFCVLVFSLWVVCGEIGSGFIVGMCCWFCVGGGLFM